MSYQLALIRRTACNRLAPEDWFILEAHKFMTDIRIQANRNRLLYGDRASDNLNFWRGHMQYLVGRLHGLWFGMSAMFIYRGSHDWLEEIADSFFNEADYLSDAYLLEAA